MIRATMITSRESWIIDSCNGSSQQSIENRRTHNANQANAGLATISPHFNTAIARRQVRSLTPLYGMHNT